MKKWFFNRITSNWRDMSDKDDVELGGFWRRDECDANTFTPRVLVISCSIGSFSE